ncbi:transposable element Tcb1 transposase [Trichonephila clavipes]|nr:transposable element Tcb1 transposase [Trichonephila clavipes]
MLEKKKRHFTARNVYATAGSSESMRIKCHNRIVMAQRKHLDEFLRSGIIGRLECGRTQLEVSEELGITQSDIFRLWKRF